MSDENKIGLEQSLRRGVRRRPLALTSAMLLFAFVAFQNCSGGEEDSMGSAPVGDSGGSPVHVIDPVPGLESWKLGTSKVEVQSATDQVVVLGNCDGQEGARLSWRVEGLESEFSGDAVCEGGEFRLDLRPLSGLPCGRRSHIIGQHGADSGALLEVIRRCDPEVVKIVPSLKESLVSAELKSAPLDCRVEVSETAGCHHVCYGEGGLVVHDQELSGEICSP